MPDAFHKFALNQTVHVVTVCTARRKVPCSTCKNTGTILFNSEEFQCPKCQGSCLNWVYVPGRHYISRAGRIGKIIIEMVTPQDLARQQYPASNAYQVQYMLDITGIISGTVHPESTLFATEAEAQAHCIAMNAQSGILPTDEPV